MPFRPSCLSALAACLLAGAVHAQPTEAPPGAPAFLSQAYKNDFAPRGQAFASEARTLVAATDRWCDGSAADGAAGLEAARNRWRSAATAWDRLAGVAVGPLVKRRALTALDFNPTRPALIDRAIATAPVGAEAMERVGTPAKGIPALEWLLWVKNPAPQSPACRYTQQVAAELAREADVLAAGLVELAAVDWAADPRRTFLAWQELFNQWLGGIERLRWVQIDKPLKTAETSGNGKPPVFGRAASGHTDASWAAQWRAAQALAVPVAQRLATAGKQPLADKLTAAFAAADAAVQQAKSQQPATLTAATRELAAVKKLLEAEVAAALDVTIGFSDGDGD